VAYSDERVASRTGRESGGRRAHTAVSRRPPISLYRIVARTEGLHVHRESSGVVQGPCSVAPVPNPKMFRLATFSASVNGGCAQVGEGSQWGRRGCDRRPTPRHRLAGRRRRVLLRHVGALHREHSTPPTRDSLFQHTVLSYSRHCVFLHALAGREHPTTQLSRQRHPAFARAARSHTIVLCRIAPSRRAPRALGGA
jgi:hypothetical protein